MDFSYRDVVTRRLARQGLSDALESAPDAVSAMVGAHAQVMTAAELSIGIRTAGETQASVRAALGPHGDLVKTYGPRGTVHLLPRADLPLWCAALDQLPSMGALPAGVAMDVDQVERAIAAIAEALPAGAVLDGDELGRAIVDTVGEWAGDPVMPAFGGWWPRWRQVIARAAYRGVLAFGPSRGSRVTYTSPAIIVEPDGDRALAWLLTRFLFTYGPATPQNFARWLGVRAPWARTQFVRFAPLLEPVLVDGSAAFVLAGDTDPPTHRPASVRLLPHFDPYVIGSFPREPLFPGLAYERALARGQAGVRPVVLVDGLVRGVWAASDVGDTLELTVELFDRPTTASSESLQAAANRVAEFRGRDARLVFAPVTRGAHK